MKKITVTIDDKTYIIEVRVNPTERNQFSVSVDGGPEMPVYVPKADDAAHLDWMVINHRPYELVFSHDLDRLTSSGGMHTIDVRASDVAVARTVSGDGRVKAPIPGLITRIMVEQGATVQVRQPLLVLEAMKMENEVRAPRAGVVHAIKVQPGKSVTLNEVIVEIV